VRRIDREYTDEEVVDMLEECLLKFQRDAAAWREECVEKRARGIKPLSFRAWRETRRRSKVAEAS
jgi:hypothetical protein